MFLVEGNESTFSSLPDPTGDKKEKCFSALPLVGPVQGTRNKVMFSQQHLTEGNLCPSCGGGKSCWSRADLFSVQPK